MIRVAQIDRPMLFADAQKLSQFFHCTFVILAFAWNGKDDVVIGEALGVPVSV